MRKYTVFIAIIALLVMTGGMLYGYFKYIPERIETTVLSSLESLGFEHLQVGTIEKHRGVVRFLNISLDDEGFSTVKEIRVHFSPFNTLLNPNRAGKIHVRGIRLTGEYTDKLTLSGWSTQRSAGFLKSPLDNFPAGTVTIEDSRADLLTDKFGGFGIDFNGQVRLENNQISLRGEVKTKQKNISYQAKIDGSIQDNGNTTINAEAAQISFTYENIKVKRGASNITFLYDPVKRRKTLTAESHMASILWQGLPLREVQSSLKKDHDGYTLTAEGKTFGSAPIAWNTRVNFAENTTTSETKIQPQNLNHLTSFLRNNNKLRSNPNFPSALSHVQSPSLSLHTTHKDGALQGQFNILLNQLALEIRGNFSDQTGDLRTVDGTFAVEPTIITAGKDKGDHTRFTVSSSGTFAIASVTENALLKWKATNHIKNGALDYGPIKIGNLNGKISLSDAKKGKRRESLTFRLPLKQNIPQRGKVTMNIKDKSAALFEQVVFYIYGGQIKTYNRLFDDMALSKSNKLIVSDINLDQLFDDAGFKNILISGTLGGVVPFHVKNNKIKVNGGILQSQSSGVIQLPEHVIAALFPGNSRKMHMIRAALKNYYYEFFEIRLDGDLSGRVLMTLKASGFNPNFNNREPVDLSLQIETQISILFKNLLR